jgi:uncharacterized protein (TIGR04255 family)
MDPAAEWDLAIPGKLQLQTELAEYSAPSRQQYVQTIAANQTKGQPDFVLSNTLFRVHLPRPDGKALLSIGANVLGVNVLKPYEGWEKYRPRIVNALKVYTAISGQNIVKRIGLRYINRLIVPVAGASHASDYLSQVQTEVAAVTPTEAKIQARLTAINTRHEFETGDGVKIYVTHATIDPTTPKTSEYLLDIDAVCDFQALDGVDKITPVMDKLHDIQGGIFEALITDEARKLFDAAPA